MLRLKYLTNKYQKRLIRPIYANTQATPYAAVLDDQTLGSGTSFRDSTGFIRAPKNTDATPLNTRTADAYTLKNSLIPGLVAVRTFGDKVAIATGANAAEQPFGLFANFVGGDLDDGFNGDSLQNQVGVWRGPDAVFELLAPAFDDTGLSSAYTAAGGAAGPVKLYAGADGRLVYNASPGNRVAVAHLIERVNANRIVIDLKI